MYITPFSSISIFEFEQVGVSLVIRLLQHNLSLYFNALHFAANNSEYWKPLQQKELWLEIGLRDILKTFTTIVYVTRYFIY